jgi:hypothetical protein
MFIGAMASSIARNQSPNTTTKPQTEFSAPAITMKLVSTTRGPNCFLWLATGFLPGWIGSEDLIGDGGTISDAGGAKARCVSAARSVRRRI